MEAALTRTSRWGRADEGAGGEDEGDATRRDGRDCLNDITQEEEEEMV